MQMRRSYGPTAHWRLRRSSVMSRPGSTRRSTWRSSNIWPPNPPTSSVSSKESSAWLRSMASTSTRVVRCSTSRGGRLASSRTTWPIATTTLVSTSPSSAASTCGVITCLPIELAVRRNSSWVIGEMACWRARSGAQKRLNGQVPQPYALELQGRARQAAEQWLRLGCTYEAAMSLASSVDEEDLRESLRQFQQLGARPAAAIVSRRLRRQGVRSLPRGPRATTLRNRSNLTERETQILAMVAEGLTNGEIAERLFLSTKTVDHHVSAILAKLGVKTRGQAAAQVR